MHCLSLEKIVAKIVPRHWTIHLEKQLQLARLKTNWDIYWLVDIDEWTHFVCIKKITSFLTKPHKLLSFLRGLPQNRWFFLNSYPWVSSQRDFKRLCSWPNDFMIESSRLYFANLKKLKQSMGKSVNRGSNKHKKSTKHQPNEWHLATIDSKKTHDIQNEGYKL